MRGVIVNFREGASVVWPIFYWRVDTDPDEMMVYFCWGPLIVYFDTNRPGVFWDLWFDFPDWRDTVEALGPYEPHRRPRYRVKRTGSGPSLGR